jgi:hypothetical protein
VTPMHVKKKFTASENYRFASYGDLVPFRSFKLNIKKKIGSCLLSGYEEQIANRYYISLANKPVVPFEMTKENNREL